MQMQSAIAAARIPGGTMSISFELIGAVQVKMRSSAAHNVTRYTVVSAVVKAIHASGAASQRRQRREPEVRLPVAPQHPVADPAAPQRSHEPRDHEHDRELAVRHRAAQSVRALHEHRHPRRDAAHREGVGRVAEHREAVLGVAEEIDDSSRIAPPSGAVRIAVRVAGAHAQHQPPEQEPGSAGDEEGLAPSPVRIDETTNAIAERRPHRCGRKENCERAPSRSSPRSSRRESRGRSPSTRPRRCPRASARRCSSRHRARETAERGGGTPEEDAARHPSRALRPVAHGAEERRGDEVDADEHRRSETDRRVGWLRATSRLMLSDTAGKTKRSA